MKLEKIVDSRAKVIDTGSVQLSPHYPGETSYATFKIANGEEWTWYSDKAATLDEGMTVLLGAWGKRETMSLRRVHVQYEGRYGMSKTIGLKGGMDRSLVGELFG